MVCHFPLHSCQCVVQSLQHLIGSGIHLCGFIGWMERERATCLSHVSSSIHFLRNLDLPDDITYQGHIWKILHKTREVLKNIVVVLHILIKSWLRSDIKGHKKCCNRNSQQETNEISFTEVEMDYIHKKCCVHIRRSVISIQYHICYFGLHVWQ